MKTTDVRINNYLKNYSCCNSRYVAPVNHRFVHNKICKKFDMLIELKVASLRLSAMLDKIKEITGKRMSISRGKCSCHENATENFYKFSAHNPKCKFFNLEREVLNHHDVLFKLKSVLDQAFGI